MTTETAQADLLQTEDDEKALQYNAIFADRHFERLTLGKLLNKGGAAGIGENPVVKFSGRTVFRFVSADGKVKIIPIVRQVKRIVKFCNRRARSRAEAVLHL